LIATIAFARDWPGMAALFVGPSSHVMRKSEAMFLKTLCWLAVGGFAFVSVGMHRLLAEATRDSAVRWCGNGITDPLSAILSFGTPLGEPDAPGNAG